MSITGITHGTITANEQIGTDNYTTIRLHPGCDHYPQGDVTITPQADWLQARRDQASDTELRKWCFEHSYRSPGGGPDVERAQQIYDFITS